MARPGLAPPVGHPPEVLLPLLPLSKEWTCRKKVCQVTSYFHVTKPAQKMLTDWNLLLLLLLLLPSSSPAAAAAWRRRAASPAAAEAEVEGMGCCCCCGCSSCCWGGSCCCCCALRGGLALKASKVYGETSGRSNEP